MSGPGKELTVMKRVSLEALTHSCRDIPYEDQCKYVLNLISDGRVKPLKASGTNGKHPALYREYWLIEQEKDCHALEEELKYRLHPLISVDYYLSHLKNYEKDRQWVWLLSEYLKHSRDRLRYEESVNERSFEIWGREKFLGREQGKRILKNCGLTEAFLHIYQTTEPLAYYSHTRQIPQNLLILENKDTFYSMRRHLLDGGGKILGMEFGTLIYGAGKGILRSFLDFDLCVEPYMRDGRNGIYYFGDLDYEGIGIYESLAGMHAGMHPEGRKVIPFKEAYEKMTEKAENAGRMKYENAGRMKCENAGRVKCENAGGAVGMNHERAEIVCGIENLPDTKEQQNRNIKGEFFMHFDKGCADKMRKILAAGKYIPQEILNIADFRR